MTEKHREELATGPWSGAVAAPSMVSMIRIPLPGSSNLAIEFRPRPRAGVTSSAIFIQDRGGKRLLRLDYGYNQVSKTYDYHWNQKGTFGEFGKAGHSSAGRLGAVLYRSAKAFRFAGSAILVVGIAVDTASIVQSSNPLRRASEVVSAWAAAWAGAESAGMLGASLGTAIEPGGGTIVLGVVFALGGAWGGYRAGEKLGAVVYDWGTAQFHKLPEMSLDALKW